MSVAVGQVAEFQKQMKQKDVVIAKQQAELVAKNDELARQHTAAAKATAASVAKLRAQLTVEQQAQLDSIEAGYNRQLAIKDQQIEAAGAMYRLEQGRVASRDSVIDKMQTVQDSLFKQVTKLTKATKQSTLDKVVQYSGWAVALITIVRK